MRVAFFCLVVISLIPGSLFSQSTDDSLAVESAVFEVKTVSKGVTGKCAAFTSLYGGPQYVSIVEINQKKRHRAGICVSKTMRTMSDLAREYKAIAAINGSYYDMQKGNSVCFLKKDNTVVDSTDMRELSIRVNAAVAVRKGKLRILPWSREIERNYKKKKGTVLASGPLMLRGGRYADWSDCDSDFIATKHPRSAIAVTKDKRVLFITVDGRSPGNAIGMSIPELTHLIKMLGGRWAINLDGGGSTMLYLNGEILNHPTDNGQFDHEGERQIPNIIFYK